MNKDLEEFEKQYSVKDDGIELETMSHPFLITGGTITIDPPAFHTVRVLVGGSAGGGGSGSPNNQNIDAITVAHQGMGIPSGQIGTLRLLCGGCDPKCTYLNCVNKKPQ